ncbi:LysM peptidoglycan-binding domain-containing protein [Aerococcus urinaeequi]|uniref:muramidase family protein n=1 Tax=Aerococcus urinaeequi TaxID=51665 RepID=UPI00366E4071
MVIEENKAVSRKSIASISKKSATLGAIVLGSAFAVSSLSANIDIPSVEASEGTRVTFASTNNAFLDSIIPDAYKLANDNDLYASVMIAQAILESNWGVSGLSVAPYYNLFGIKGTYNGKGVTFYTLEDDGSGNYYQIRDSFRDYPSYKESLNDYANKMVNGVSWDSEFYSGTWKSNTSSYKDATAALTGTYATDTRYGGKLNNLITTHGLTQYDTPAGSTSSTSASVSGATTNLSAQGTTSSTNGGKSYTVKAGDGLYTVARALGVTVAEVKAQNGLTSNLIHPGQVLSVASSSASSSSSSASTGTVISTGSSASTSGKSYTVKSGDGLYSVAKALGISVSEARSLNGGSDLIHPGQVFKAGQSTTSTSSSSSSSSASANTGSSSASTSTSGKSYTVKSGDGLYSVAKALGISVSEARALNGGSDLIHPGQVFKASQSTTSTSSSSSSSSSSANTGSSSASTSGKSYTVKSGDGLYRVAKALGISVSEARALNGGSDLIHPGQVFKAGQSTTSTSSSSSSSSTSANTGSSSASTSGKSYTVKSGDGLYTVARALGISVSEARALNGGSDLIHPGKVFTAGSSSQGSSSQASSSSVSSTSSASTSQSSASTSTSTSYASTSGNSYTVKSGDGIYTVARALGISLAEARALNGGSDLIHPGKVFTTGGSSQASSSQASSSASTSSSSQASTSSSTSTASSSATSNAKTHTVKSGETLYRIAKNNGLSLDELMTLNGLSNYNLYIGQVLKLN